MRVELRRYATLQGATGLPGTPNAVELPADTTIAELIRRLDLPAADVHLVVVDGRIVHDRDAKLHDGARVALFPPIGGG
jgi:sulfur carrier protein ThiS